MKHTYENICDHVDSRTNAQAVGIAPFNQGDEGEDHDVEIDEGICQGIVIEWLKHRRDNKIEQVFSSAKKVAEIPVKSIQDGKAKPTKDTKPIGDQTLGTLERAKIAQANYEEGISSRDDEQLPYTVGVELGRRGFSEKTTRLLRLPNDRKAANWKAVAYDIATKIEEAQFNYFNISIEGVVGDKSMGHAIAAYRPAVLIGKSKTFRIFDPNIGEFEVNKDSADDTIRMLLENYTDLMTDAYSIVIDGIQKT